MNTMLLSRDIRSDAAQVEPLRSSRSTDGPETPVRRRQRRFAPAIRRPHGRDDRFRGPQLRPVISPSFGVGSTRVLGEVEEPALRPLGCATVSPPRWRLTDRGIAVVLVTGLMIVVAGLTVVTATALHVTSESYQVTSQLQG